MKHLLLTLDGRRLYLVDDEDLRSTVVTSGPLHLDQERVEAMELTSFLVLSIPREVLARHLVPDRRVCQELRALNITGLQPAVSLRTGADSLPLAGNLVDPTWLSICLSGRCDSKCVFCFTDFIRNDRGLSFDQVMDTLKCGREAGVEIVVFSGGEPTLCRDLVTFVQEARALGYGQIGIQTNGHRMAREEYLAGLIDAGLSSVLVSLHAPNAPVHDRLARTANSFARASQALTNIENTTAGSTVNFVVCRDNGPLAVQMVGYVARRYPRATLRFSFLIVEGAASIHLRQELPTIPEFIDWIGCALGRGDELGVAIEVENVPPCVSSALGTPKTYVLSQRRSLMQASPFYAADRYRGELGVKMAACDRCAMVADCSGLQMAYLANIPGGAEHVYPIERPV